MKISKEAKELLVDSTNIAKNYHVDAAAADVLLAELVAVIRRLEKFVDEPAAIKQATGDDTG